MPLHICILETDILRPELIDHYKGYGWMFQQLFAKQPLPAEFKVYNVVQGHYPPAEEKYDAYLVTGSKADSFGSDPWIQRLKEYLLERYQQGDRLLGVCFGHQLLALVLGGKTERAVSGWGIGVHHYQIDEQPKWMSPQLNELTLLVSHQDQVTQLPENARRIASSEFCPNAAYAVGDQVLCFQGHPEFIKDYSQAIMELRKGSFSESVFQTGMDSLKNPHQGITVAEWMMRFVQAGKACKQNAA